MIEIKLSWGWILISLAHIVTIQKSFEEFWRVVIHTTCGVRYFSFHKESNADRLIELIKDHIRYQANNLKTNGAYIDIIEYDMPNLNTGGGN